MRIIVSLILGLLVTFGLFVFMDALISNDQQKIEPPEPTPVIDMIDEPKETKPKERPPLQPKPEPIVKPNIQHTIPNDSNTDGIDVQPELEPPVITPTIVGGPTIAPPDGDATPIVRVEARYPIKAQQDGKEGWVKLKFTITELGSVDDVEVIQAEPKRTFDKAAIRALRQWKYKPKVIDGKPVSQFGQEVVLEFSMGK